MLCIVGDLAFGQVSGKRTRWDFEMCGGFFHYEHVYDVIFTQNSVNALQCIAFPIPFRKVFNLLLHLLQKLPRFAREGAHPPPAPTPYLTPLLLPGLNFRPSASSVDVAKAQEGVATIPEIRLIG